MDVSFGGAALAGVLSFLSPCVLPMVPFYLCYLGGLTMQEVREGTALPSGAHRRLVLSATAFALGVTSVFMLLGLGASAVGQVFLEWQAQLRWLAAGVLMLFALHFLGLLRLALLNREARLSTTATPAGMFGGYLMGLAFGFGWTPCVGPVLAAVLMMAAGMGDALRGALLLSVYGLAMTAPFILAAVFVRPFVAALGRARRHLGRVEKATGALLAVFAVLIATDSLALIADAMLRGMPWLGTLG